MSVYSAGRALLKLAPRLSECVAELGSCCEPWYGYWFDRLWEKLLRPWRILLEWLS
ncbi:hypothetical protein K493DRAFT_315051 [Basidiobolus meristosporus CBS 931.73]|uniref:Uncharacterized protein n=1 Tax=Basidiobolus meristosporus CBS 931.73 TaxID=1314790 RepID=A0A1Y1YCK5_9FUNG|nr:hypothetical protein K493DRAFT_315051 [Basidiobolus meristosporus CBS 931.73]|eukprot:ORX95344.1 hypothetical protein K493DRAFT_315051 [Basidiobolus meristosporus CBS 931.73]